MKAKDEKPKTTGQVRTIFGQGRRCGLDPEQLRDAVEDVTKRTRSIAALSYTEAEQVIARLKGREFVPRRTLQYRRQKAGIQQVVQQGQLTLIAELAAQRNWSAETLAGFCKRQCKHERPRTTGEANSVIEALKDMNRRDDLWVA